MERSELLSLVIPAHNEERCIAETVQLLHHKLKEENIPHEFIVVNDNSTDKTEEVLQELQQTMENLHYINNPPPNGFGLAVRCGLNHYSGGIVGITMADGSDYPQDIVAFYREILQGYDCAFGSRFTRKSQIVDYPKHKLILNRLTNYFIQLLFQFSYNDTTNACKMYRAYVLDGLRPFLSHHFNLTVELPLKAIIRGYNYSVVPNNWRNRKYGVSKLKIKEMGSRYLFIILYCLIEKWLSRNDYHSRSNKPKAIVSQ